MPKPVMRNLPVLRHLVRFSENATHLDLSHAQLSSLEWQAVWIFLEKHPDLLTICLANTLIPSGHYSQLLAALTRLSHLQQLDFSGEYSLRDALPLNRLDILPVLERLQPLFCGLHQVLKQPQKMLRLPDIAHIHRIDLLLDQRLSLQFFHPEKLVQVVWRAQEWQILQKSLFVKQTVDEAGFGLYRSCGVDDFDRATELECCWLLPDSFLGYAANSGFAQYDYRDNRWREKPGSRRINEQGKCYFVIHDAGKIQIGYNAWDTPLRVEEVNNFAKNPDYYVETLCLNADEEAVENSEIPRTLLASRQKIGDIRGFKYPEWSVTRAAEGTLFARLLPTLNQAMVLTTALPALESKTTQFPCQGHLVQGQCILALTPQQILVERENAGKEYILYRPHTQNFGKRICNGGIIPVWGKNLLIAFDMAGDGQSMWQLTLALWALVPSLVGIESTTLQKIRQYPPLTMPRRGCMDFIRNPILLANFNVLFYSQHTLLFFYLSHMEEDLRVAAAHAGTLSAMQAGFFAATTREQVAMQRGDSLWMALP